MKESPATTTYAGSFGICRALKLADSTNKPSRTSSQHSDVETVLAPSLPTIPEAIEFIAIQIITIFVYGYLHPQLGQSVTEARVAQTWREVRELHKTYEVCLGRNDKPPNDSELSMNDPWDRPFIIEWSMIEGRWQVEVRSAGPDGLVASGASENDDIYYGMPNSPLDHYREARRRQWRIAFLTALGVWLALSAVYCRKRKRRWDA